MSQSQSRLHQFPLPEEVVELSVEKTAVTKARLQLWAALRAAQRAGVGLGRQGMRQQGPWEGCGGVSTGPTRSVLTGQSD